MKSPTTICTFVGGRLNGKKMSIRQVWALHWNGQVTENYSVERMQGRCVHREELDSQPLVNGYLSPCWDGNGLRYETLEVAEMLSR